MRKKKIEHVELNEKRQTEKHTKKNFFFSVMNKQRDKISYHNIPKNAEGMERTYVGIFMEIIKFLLKF